MDEFCANKDTQLRRCACSSRLHEFDQAKAQLAKIEDKMLDFNQRLLTVNMDAEDIAAINTATEGELAFQQKDTSESKKILDEIAAKLKNSSVSGLDADASTISWSLNIDAAFDHIDSTLGASTSTKEGVALYNAALPVCQEMAAEVCDDDALDLAVSGYLMQIEQDCTTVAKAYETQNDQVREKIREEGALLDMSRLDIYQKRNSDDILTCKKKMLTMLSDSSVCGNNLGKCLDTTGQYIDPSTGEAFLTTNLINLSTLLTRPTGDTKWTEVPGNDKFVTYLNTKKQFLAPAMENCQDIADLVWNEFVEDALAQIKLAQESKLEDMRQSCTSLTTQCLSDAAQSLADFDARALSIFGVARDKTVNEMCSSIKNACTALLDASDIGDTSWSDSMTEIATDTTYDTIISTCREVGRNCIIQACKSISGNFGLCENIDTSINRKAIINRTSCWNEVLQCVQEAGDNAVDRIYTRLEGDADVTSGTANATQYRGSFYKRMYGGTGKRLSDSRSDKTKAATVSDMNSLLAAVSDSTEQKSTWCDPEDTARDDCVYDICYETCKPDADGKYSTACHSCRLAEQIWGNCEFDPTTSLETANAHNRIIGDDSSTLLAWFAKNTGTSNSTESCRDTTCGPGWASKMMENGAVQCVPKANLTQQEDKICSTDMNNRISITDDKSWENCCQKSENQLESDPWPKDSAGNCCSGLADQAEITIPVSTTLGYWSTGTVDGPKTKFCLPENTELVAQYASGQYLLCVPDGPTVSSENPTSDTFPGGTTIICNGHYVLLTVSSTGTTSNPKFYFYYLTPSYNKGMNNINNAATLTNFINGYHVETYGSICKYTGTGWDLVKDPSKVSANDRTTCDFTPNNWQVTYTPPTQSSPDGE